MCLNGWYLHLLCFSSINCTTCLGHSIYHEFKWVCPSLANGKFEKFYVGIKRYRVERRTIFNVKSYLQLCEKYQYVIHFSEFLQMDKKVIDIINQVCPIKSTCIRFVFLLTIIVIISYIYTCIHVHVYKLRKIQSKFKFHNKTLLISNEERDQWALSAESYFVKGVDLSLC